MFRSHPAPLRRIAAYMTTLAVAVGLSALAAAPASAAGRTSCSRSPTRAAP